MVWGQLTIYVWTSCTQCTSVVLSISVQDPLLSGGPTPLRKWCEGQKWHQIGCDITVMPKLIHVYLEVRPIGLVRLAPRKAAWVPCQIARWKLRPPRGFQPPLREPLMYMFSFMFLHKHVVCTHVEKLWFILNTGIPGERQNAKF